VSFFSEARRWTSPPCKTRSYLLTWSNWLNRPTVPSVCRVLGASQHRHSNLIPCWERCWGENIIHWWIQKTENSSRCRHSILLEVALVNESCSHSLKLRETDSQTEFTEIRNAMRLSREDSLTKWRYHKGQKLKWRRAA
jgi:hypothetical protein